MEDSAENHVRRSRKGEYKNLKLISWNVNGLRACMGKNFLEVFRNFDADFFCLQETKLQEGQISLELPGYEIGRASCRERV